MKKELKKLNVVAFMALRGSSKSIPFKNIKILAGKPLCYWALKAASDSDYINKIYVSTEHHKIKKVVNSLDFGVEIIDRPEELAEDDTKLESIIFHFLEKVVDFDLLVIVQATSPFTRGEDIDTALESFIENDYDSMFTGVLHKKFFWTPKAVPLNYNYMKRPMRQQFEGVVHENGAFYITKRKILEKNKNRLGGNIGIYLFPPERGIDIDEPEDWIEAEKIIKKYNLEAQ